jgi:hypothetical protein
MLHCGLTGGVVLRHADLTEHLYGGPAERTQTSLHPQQRGFPAVLVVLWVGLMNKAEGIGWGLDEVAADQKSGPTPGVSIVSP